MYIDKNGYIWKDSLVLKGGVGYGLDTLTAIKLDEYDTECYTRLLEVALANETDRAMKEQQLLEMSKVVKKDTGLPVDIWVDEGNTFSRTGHWRRIKFQGIKGDGNTKNWVPMTISLDPQIPKTNGKTVKYSISQRDVEKVRQFVISNFDLLNKLGSGVTLGDFYKNMKRV